MGRENSAAVQRQTRVTATGEHCSYASFPLDDMRLPADLFSTAGWLHRSHVTYGCQLCMRLGDNKQPCV